jgi:hypothetical protein
MELQARGEVSHLSRKRSSPVEPETTSPEPSGPQGGPLYPRARPRSRRTAARSHGPGSIPRGPETRCVGALSSRFGRASGTGFRVSVVARRTGRTKLARLPLLSSEIEKMCSISPSPQLRIAVRARPPGTGLPLMPPRLRHPFCTWPEAPVYFLLVCGTRRNQIGICLEEEEQDCLPRLRGSKGLL